MENITRILNEVAGGDLKASEQLLPLIYADLKKLAAARLAMEKPGQNAAANRFGARSLPSIGAGNDGQSWNGRAHFFGAASEAMRRILVDIARRKVAAKRGGNIVRQEANFEQLALPMESEALLALDQALNQLHTTHRRSQNWFNSDFSLAFPWKRLRTFSVFRFAPLIVTGFTQKPFYVRRSTTPASVLWNLVRSLHSSEPPKRRIPKPYDFGVLLVTLYRRGYRT